MAFPFFWVVLTSIRPESEIFSDTFRLITETVTFKNYAELLSSGFVRYIRNSLFVGLTTTFTVVVFALLAAYSFSRRRFRLRTPLLILVVFSQLFPYIILITPIYMMFFRIGLVNTFLGLIIGYVAISVPFSIYMLLGYLDSVPLQLDEAAIIDGASTLDVIFRVVLPVAWPGIAVTAIYTFIRTWNDYLFALVIVSRDELKTVQVGLANFFGQYTTQWDLVMAASVFATLPTLFILFFLQRHLVSGLAAGAVKQ